jgi:hypothetical protein
MIALSAPPDYLALPPYIVTRSTPEGDRAEGFMFMADAFLEWITVYDEHQWSMIVDARGAAIVKYVPGAGLRSLSITSQLVEVASNAWPDGALDFLGVEMVATEFRVLREQA